MGNTRCSEGDPLAAVVLLGLGVREFSMEVSAVPEIRETFRRVSVEEARRVGIQVLPPDVNAGRGAFTLEGNAIRYGLAAVKNVGQGSVEAIVEALKKIESTKVSLEVIHSGVGAVTESDVLLAAASKAVVLGFHCRIDSGASEVAKREGVQIRLYSIIYELIDQVKEAMAGLLEPIYREVVTGSAEVRKKAVWKESLWVIKPMGEKD